MDVREIDAGGHTRRSGPAAYNLRLSRRRCAAVKAALVRRGFAPEEIRMEAFGETRLLFETEDGVPERMNRFVMIMIESAPPPQPQPQPPPQPQPQPQQPPPSPQ